MQFSRLEKTEKKIVFYAEGRSDWSHFSGLISELIKKKYDVVYLTSQIDDPILEAETCGLKTYYIGAGTARTILFSSINAVLFIMTLPDIGTFHLKRSHHNVKYVYIFHSIVSTHAAYQKDAFRAFDVIFCVGPHHSKEFEELHRLDGITNQSLFNYGYNRLDAIAHKKKYSLQKPQFRGKHVLLLAPTWGTNSITNICLKQIISVLIDEYHIIFRPHPMSFSTEKLKIKETLDSYGKHPNFSFDTDILSEKTLMHADLMISDWSGAAFEYSFGLERPVLFINVPKKVRNYALNRHTSPIFEDTMRFVVGSVLNLDQLENIKPAVENLINNKKSFELKIRRERKRCIYNFGESSMVGANELMRILNVHKDAEVLNQ